MATNVPLALLVTGGAGLLVWAGITDPPGGLAAQVSNALRGLPVAKRDTTNASASAAAGIVQAAAWIAGPGAAAPTTANASAVGVASGSVGAAALAFARAQIGETYV